MRADQALRLLSLTAGSNGLFGAWPIFLVHAFYPGFSLVEEGDAS